MSFAQLLVINLNVEPLNVIIVVIFVSDFRRRREKTLRKTFLSQRCHLINSDSIKYKKYIKKEEEESKTKYAERVRLRFLDPVHRKKLQDLNEERFFTTRMMGNSV